MSTLTCNNDMPSRPRERALHVLVAEDNEINQKVALAILRRAGHTVVVVPNGREAVEAVKTGSFDLVLMDVYMPGVDGLEATRAIRLLERQTATGSIPIVAVTTGAMNGDKDACLEAGMNAYVAKPYTAQHLMKVVEQVLQPAAQPCFAATR